MGKYTIGPRLHDYGCDIPDRIFALIAADGYKSMQLAIPKAIAGVASYEDITNEVIKEIKAALEKYQLEVGVLGNYIELAIDYEEERMENIRIFKRQLATAKALGAKCIGTETTAMKLQPKGTSRERGLYLLCKSLEQILPEAERLGVNVAIEAVSWHSMNTPEATRQVLDTMGSEYLKVIFDAGNLLTLPEVNRQRQLWERSAGLYGEKIVAIHYKTQGFHSNGDSFPTSRRENVIDWDCVFDVFKALPQEITVLREEADPALASEDVAELKRLISR